MSDFGWATKRLEAACYSAILENFPAWHRWTEFHEDQTCHARRIKTCPVKTQCEAPIMQNEDDLLVSRDNSGAEFIEIQSVSNRYAKWGSLSDAPMPTMSGARQRVWLETWVLRSATARMRLGYRGGRASPVAGHGSALVQYPRRPSRHRGFLRASG